MSPEARRRHERLVVAGLALACLLAIALFLSVGARGSWSFVLAFRGTKVLAMVLVGTAIAVSTVLFQTVTANRILTPSIMGFDALYALIQTLLVFGLGAAATSALDPRLVFGAEVAVMVGLSTLLYRWLFAGGLGSLYLLVLVGIVFGTLFRSVSGLLQRLIDPNEFVVLQDRMFASFNTVDGSLLAGSSAAILAISAFIARRIGRLDVLGLGRDAAVNLGLDHRREVTIALVLVSLLVSISTALVGPVTFFGLLVANLAYLTIRSHRHAVVLPAAALIAILALVGGQFVLERVFRFDIALSIVIEFVGGLAFLVLLVRGLNR
ncbi:iron chelate uptake ABC transporter family permease subunit [Aureimonas sp. AU12]|uniref:iron chelate uptake ABC transporter family permease subunit n=1 Tax=Aureimonas sp. AU12 TaxID=1638161 RepID=UPI000780BF07